MKLLSLTIAALMLLPVTCHAGEPSSENGVVENGDVGNEGRPINADSDPVELTFNIMRDSRRQLYFVGHELRGIDDENGSRKRISTSEFHRRKVGIANFFDGKPDLRVTFTVSGWSTGETLLFPDATRWTLKSISKAAMLSKFKMESIRKPGTESLASLAVPFDSRVWAADNDTSPGQISHFGCGIDCRLVEDAQLQLTVRGHRKQPGGEVDRLEKHVLKNVEEGMTIDLVPGSKHKVRLINYGDKEKNIRGWIEIVRVEK